MADTTPKMALRRWDQLSDLFSHDQLSDNWAKIDFHDHTPGRGVQIPTEGIFDGAITVTKLATGLDPSSAYTSFKVIRNSLADFGASAAAGTYVMSENRPSTVTIGSAGAQGIYYFDPSDYTVTSRSTMLRLRVTMAQGNVAPGITITVGMYPVSGTSTGSAVVGAVVTGSTVALVATTINTLSVGVSSEFAAPAAGYYLTGFLTSGVSAASSAAQLRAEMQMRQV